MTLKEFIVFGNTSLDKLFLFDWTNENPVLFSESEGWVVDADEAQYHLDLFNVNDILMVDVQDIAWSNEGFYVYLSLTDGEDYNSSEYE